MLSIGDFARVGGLSVRVLRHYDGIGLLVPARVDPVTGYRWYDAGQLSRLNRIVALEDLGFTLEQVRVLVDDRVEPAELRGMLRMRRAELVAQLDELVFGGPAGPPVACYDAADEGGVLTASGFPYGSASSTGWPPPAPAARSTCTRLPTIPRRG